MVVVVDDSDLNTNTTVSRRAFARLVEPLERASGRRLGNPARERCFAAFERHPEGVREVARGALVDAVRNPVGLFVHRIENGWHELEPVPPSGVSTDSSEAPSFRRWLRNVGSAYAHSSETFAEEVARFGVDSDQAEELRRVLLEDAA
jgi:hypothetical protein